MTKGMSEIKNRADATFTFVGGYHPGLVGAGAVNRLSQQPAITPHQPRDIAGLPLQEVRIADQSVFNHFCHSCGQLTRRQGFQSIGIGNHGLRLMESSDHVLTERVIHTGFTTDGGIHL